MPDRVIVALPDRLNEFQHLQAADAQATAARLGLEVELLDADGNAILQIQQLFKFIHAQDRPRALLVEPVAIDGMERVAHKAAEAGLGVGFLLSTVSHIEDLRRQFPRLPFFMLGSDQVEIGRLQGRQMKLLLPAGGTALYIHGPLTATAARERYQGMQEETSSAALRTVVIDSHWTEESAEQVARKWLRLKTTEALRIDLVACQNDAMARGARRAFEATREVAAQWGDVPFLGIDGVPAMGQRMVADRLLTATVVMPSNTGPALEVIARWLRTGQLPPPSIRVPVTSFPSEERLGQRA